MNERKNPRVGGIWPNSFLVGVALTAMLIFGLVVLAQDAENPPATPEPTSIPESQAITASEIPDQAAATGRLLREAVASHQAGEEIAAMEDLFAEEREHLTGLEEETRRRLEIDGPASVLEETENAWQRGRTRLDGWLQELKDRGATIDFILVRLEAEQEAWELTSSLAKETDLPPEVLDLVDDTLEAIKNARSDVRSHRDALLTLQSRITKTNGLVYEILASQQEEINRRRRGIIGIDSPPLWLAFTTPGVDGSPGEQIVAIGIKNYQSVRQYVAEQQSSLFRHLLILAALTVTLLFLRGKARFWAKQDR